MKSALLIMSLGLSVLLSWTPFSWATEAIEKTQETQETQETQVTQETQQTLDINTATVQEIASVLTGVGPVKAEAIVALREALGGFTDIEQLLEVKGIGSATIERVRELIVIQ